MRPLAFVALTLACLFAACATTARARHDSTATFRLDAAQAEQVILEAVREGWPDKTPDPAGADEIGYSFLVHWGMEMDRVHARAVSMGDGAYRFEVWNVGDAPVAGGPARLRLRDLLQAAAERIAGG